MRSGGHTAGVAVGLGTGGLTAGLGAAELGTVGAAGAARATTTRLASGIRLASRIGLRQHRVADGGLDALGAGRLSDERLGDQRLGQHL